MKTTLYANSQAGEVVKGLYLRTRQVLILASKRARRTMMKALIMFDWAARSRLQAYPGG